MTGVLAGSWSRGHEAAGWGRRGLARGGGDRNPTITPTTVPTIAYRPISTKLITARAVGSRTRIDQAWSDHARMRQLLQTCRGEIDLKQIGRLHLVETRAHAPGPPPLELGPTPSPTGHSRPAVADRSGRDRLLPHRRRHRFSLRPAGATRSQPPSNTGPPSARRSRPAAGPTNNSTGRAVRHCRSGRR
jgi:hypothetical protein